MAVTGPAIAAVRLACHDVRASMDFYIRTFDGRPTSTPGSVEALLLGEQRLEFIAAENSAEESEPHPGSNATSFQHCAIVVTEMDAAMVRLRASSGWQPISLDGPETLPERSGGVTAFKFRDPDGHPLELLQFPQGQGPERWRGAAPSPFLGIDHTAICVSDADRSIAFYTGHGFELQARQINEGPEQGRLDGLGAKTRVEVVSLVPTGAATPHLELLAYRQPEPVREPAREGSVLATTIRLSGDAPLSIPATDPDGHGLSTDGA